MLKEMSLILENKEIIKDVFQMILKSPEITKTALPGQFVNIDIGSKEHMLRRPISICQIKKDSLILIYKVIGKGTDILSQKKVGEYLDVLGPLGSEFPLVKNKKCLLIGGGLGIPPLSYLSEVLLKNNNQVIPVLGFSKGEDIFGENLFQNPQLATIDGSKGFKGTVLDLIKNKNLDFDFIYTCGPVGMLKAIEDTYNDKVEGYISFEERMACGFGACYGCAVLTKFGSMVRVCKEGPVFPMGVIDYGKN